MRSPAYCNPIFRFGVFEFDPRSFELRKNGLQVRLPRQSAKLLHALLQTAGRLCTREQLRRELWPANTFVSFEHSLTKAVYGLRQVLGDIASTPRYIETLAGRGYRFVILPERETNRRRTLESLAVLPLVSATGAENCAFLVGQLTYRLISKLCSLRNLRVLACSIVKQCNVMDPRAAGRQLAVDAVIAGEILQQGSCLILNLELVDVNDGTQIWGEQLEDAWPQTTDRIQQLVDEIAQRLQPVLMRKYRHPVSEMNPESTTSRTKVRRFTVPGPYPPIQRKKISFA